MMHIIHGEQFAESRAALQQLIDKSRDKKLPLIRLMAKELTPAVLEETFGSTSLFDDSKTIIIEELHSLPRSKKKTELIELVAAAAANSEDTLILWEKRSLTKTMLKKFPGARVQEFKVSKAVFNWLDSLNGKRQNQRRQIELLRQAVAQDDAYFCVAMLARQLRMLIQVKEEGSIKAAPFIVSKLKSQAATYTMPQLLDLHRKLAELDYQSKTGSHLAPLETALELLILS